MRPARPQAVQRVVVADNDSLFRVGLRNMLTGMFPGAVVVEVNCCEALETVLAAAPADLALIDLGLPQLSGYLSVLTLLQHHPRTRFVAISGLEPPLAAPRVLALGMSGFVSKRAPHDKIARVVAQLRRQPCRVPPRERSLIDGLLRLTPTETRMFTLLPDNPSHRHIMQALNIALPTVKTHMSRILQKLDLRNRTEAAIVAKRLTIFEVRRLYIEQSIGRKAAET